MAKSKCQTCCVANNGNNYSSRQINVCNNGCNPIITYKKKPNRVVGITHCDSRVIAISKLNKSKVKRKSSKIKSNSQNVSSLKDTILKKLGLAK